MSSSSQSRPAHTMWGGRFASGPSALMEEINASIHIDRRLASQDIEGSRAHAQMLVATGILSAEDGAAIARGLDQVGAEIEAGTFPFRRELEDIHMNIEARLAELIGPAAGRLHTARSRNDQVATDFRLWTRTALERLEAQVRDLQGALIDQAERHAATIMPGFTHLQAAQPVTMGHHLLAYVEMLGRDRGRLTDARQRLNECPLGAGALAGTTWPIDRHMSAAALGFERPCANSLDAVSARDFALEALAAGSILALTLSRLAEEIVLWMSAQFRFIDLPHDLTTGSSMMPQKRNPDAAELVRAKAGRVLGALTTLATVMKGLPLAYSKDMQEDKEPLFGAIDTLDLCLVAMTGMVAGMTVNAEACRAAAQIGHTTATDLADHCARTLGMPFRQAHEVAGRLVARAEELGVDVSRLDLADLKAVAPDLDDNALAVLDVAHAVEARTSFGGTAPANVTAQVAEARARFLAD